MQTNWTAFQDLQTAWEGTRGKTHESLRLVTEELYADETVQGVLAAAIRGISGWSDAVVVLTDRRLFVSRREPNVASMSYTEWSAGVRGTGLIDLQPLRGSSSLPNIHALALEGSGVLPQSAPNFVRFKATGVTDSTVVLPRQSFDWLLERLRGDDEQP
jgi:hypothetical protein